MNGRREQFLLEARLPRAALPCFMLAILALYLLLHPYSGVIHDARLYALQALNRLHPDLYGNDVFLKYGSQDSFTLFTPFYAAIISLFGVESAAGLITALSALAYIAAAWVLARTLTSPAAAALGVAVLAVIPGYYGSDDVFALIEGFATPRMFSEALVLCSIAAYLRSQRWLSGSLLLIAGVLHPIMAFPGLLLLLAMTLALPFWRLFWPLSLAAVAVLVVAIWAPLPVRWQLDESFRPGSALLLAEWRLHDWARVSTVLVTLVLATLTLPRAASRLACGMLLVTAGALLLSFLGGDILKLALVLRGQGWRSLWLATTLAAILLPWTARYCFSGSPWSRCAVLLLLCAWLAGPWSLALCFTLPAAIAIFLDRADVGHAFAVVSQRAAVIALCVLIACMISINWVEGPALWASDAVGGTIQAARTLTEDRVIPAMALVAVWFVVLRVRSAWVVGSVSALMGTAVAVLLIAVAPAWASRLYDARTHGAFSAWRAEIPKGEDVLFAARVFPGSDPALVWLLLERPSFYSAVQANSGLFSRAAAVELARRRRAIPVVLPTENPVKIEINAPDSHVVTCSDVPARYIVSEKLIEGARIVAVPANIGAPINRIRLHIC